MVTRYMEYEMQKVRQLAGCEILRPIVSEDGEWWGFQVMKRVRGRRSELLNVWVLRDEEGNGPGSLSVEGVERDDSAVKVRDRSEIETRKGG